MKTDLEVIVGGLLLLMLLSRAAKANQSSAMNNNPYAYNTNETQIMNPGAMDLNGWNALNAAPAYYLGQVPAQSPMDAYLVANNTSFIGAQSVPVGSF